jgi:hypothetical protein
MRVIGGRRELVLTEKPRFKDLRSGVFLFGTV